MVTALAALAALTALAVLAVTRSSPRQRRRALAGVLVIALAAAGLQVGGTGSRGAIVVGGVLLLFGLLAIAVATWGRAASGPVVDPPAARRSSRLAWSSSDQGAITLLSIHAAALLLALVVPHLHLLELSLTIAIIAGVLLERRLDAEAFPQFGQGVTMLLFLGSWYALSAVAGEAPLGLGALRDAPYSPAFEVTVALPLALGAWPLLGLFPFHQTRLGPLAPLAGGALLVRVAAVAVPNGLAHWQPLLFLLLVVAMTHALLTRRDAEALGALAGLGLLSGVAAAGWCGLGLAAGVTVIRGHTLLTAAGRVLNPRGEALVRGLAVTGALLVVPVLSGGLAAEAVYTVLIALGGVLLLWKR